MFRKKKKVEDLSNKLDMANDILEKMNLRELADILGNKKQIFWRNFIAGISRGIGVAIGVTLLGAVIIYGLQKIVLLNIPVIGEYISDIADIVEKNKSVK